MQWRGVPQGRRALVTAGVAGGLLFAVALHCAGRGAAPAAAVSAAQRVWAEELGGSPGAPVHLRGAGEYARYISTLGRHRSPPRAALRSRNPLVALKDVPHEHVDVASLPVEYFKHAENWNRGGGPADDGDGDSDSDNDKSILRCKDMVHVQQAGLLARDVSVGIYLLNMELYAGEPGVFYADFLLFLRQRDHPMQMPDGSDPWDTLGFANAKNIASIESFGSTKGLRRVQGSFFFSPDLRWFPFDTQELSITVEQIKIPVSRWVFFPDWHLNGISDEIRFPGWRGTLQDQGTSLAHCHASVAMRTMPGAVEEGISKFGNVTFSTYTYKLQVHRPPVQGLITNFIPPAIMMTPAIYSAVVDPLAHWTLRLSLGGSAVMTLVFFHSSQAKQMPILNYLTAFDKYVYCVYLFIFSNIAALISIMVGFREQLEDPDSVPFLLREDLLTVSMYIGAYSFLVLFLVLLPLWWFLLSNSMVCCVWMHVCTHTHAHTHNALPYANRPREHSTAAAAPAAAR